MTSPIQATQANQATQAVQAVRARAARAALAAITCVAAAAAQAHTGHGHDELGTIEGMLHALRAPDHLAMVALGVVVTAAAAPFVLRVAARLGRRLGRGISALARRARQGAAG
ncbi:MAG: hypothetical protein HZC37_10195 [Burkholderiales bacterium]|nr:hypothetical protein [Burkholderiales bacterium]